MPRKSQAALAAELAAPIQPSTSEPLAPPEAMGEREKGEWRPIIERFGSEHFPPETRTLLAALCGVMVQLADVGAELATFAGIPRERERWRSYRDLTRLRVALGSQAVTLGTKLRVLPQSRDVRRRNTADYDRRVVQSETKPWQFAI